VIGTLPPPAAGTLLEARDLRTWFPAGGRWLGRPRWIRAVDGVSLTLATGEILGLVGESDCGKTTLGRSVLRLVAPTGGELRFEGRDLRALEGRALRRLRRWMQILFQDPQVALSPRHCRCGARARLRASTAARFRAATGGRSRVCRRPPPRPR
jgi:ABC-type oligopeptide transport system ATPase subunit